MMSVLYPRYRPFAGAAALVMTHDDLMSVLYPLHPHFAGAAAVAILRHLHDHLGLGDAQGDSAIIREISPRSFFATFMIIWAAAMLKVIRRLFGDYAREFAEIEWAGDARGRRGSAVRISLHLTGA